MATQVSTKVRLVRCPKCRQVLVELPDVFLYECGGCGTILQAKNQKMDTNHCEFSSQVTDSTAKTQQDNVSEEEEARSSNHDLTSAPKEDSSPDKDNIRYQDEHVESSTELFEDRSVSNGLSSSPEVNSPENADSPIVVKESLDHDKGNCPLDQNAKIYDSELHDSDGESSEGRNFSGEFPSSSELIYHGTEELTPEASELVEEYDKSYLDQHTSVDQFEGGESLGVWQEGDNFLDEVQNLSEHEEQENVLPPVGGEHREGINNNFAHLENDEKSRDGFVDQIEGFSEGTRHAEVNSLCAEFVSYENGNASQSAEPSSEVDDDFEVTPSSKRPSTEKKLNPSVGDSIVASQSGALKGSIVSVNLTSPDDERLDHSPRKATQNFGSASSVELLGSSLLADPDLDPDPDPELRVKRGDTTDSPTIRSYYGYDGSESSNDGTDDQIPVHIPHPSRRKGKGVDHVSTKAMLKKDGFSMKSMLNSEPEMNYWAPSSSSALQGNHHHAIKGNHWNQDEFPETKRHSHTGGNTMRLDEGGASRLPFTSRNLPANHRTGSTSIYRHNFPPPHPHIHSPDKPLYSEPDKMDLLRTVCELKDQLNRIQFPKISRNGRFHDGVMKEKSAPFYYDHLTPKRDLYGNLNHPGYYVRHNQEKGWAEQSNFSKLAFSGEAAHYRHQVNCSRLHCCTQDWRCSAQLPSHSSHYKNDHSVVHSGHNRCNISSSSSPKHYTSSELSLLGHETKSDSQRHRDDEMKRLYLRDKYHTAKKHLRPIAGGAPLVSCYHCSELLQLPADFLLFKKRYHQLRCNACSKVLKFFLMKRTHVVPYLPDVSSAPPPSEADDYSDATNQRNLVPRPHSSFCQHGEPVSYSDDYGRSFCRSCSTEGEASVITPSFGLVERNRYNRKMSSGSSYEAMEDKKMKSILKESTNKNKSLVETLESVGPSSELPNYIKASSEIEELPPSTSPLHRLMGYTSPSQVLNKRSDSDRHR